MTGKTLFCVTWCLSQHPAYSFAGYHLLLLSHSVVSDSLWPAVHQASLSLTISQSLLKLMSIESVMLSNHLILCPPLLLLPSIFPSIRVFSNESVLCIRWPKYWSLSFSISPSNEYPGLISFRIDWFDLLEVQGTLKSILQHHNSPTHIHIHKDVEESWSEHSGFRMFIGQVFEKQNYRSFWVGVDMTFKWKSSKHRRVEE